MGTSSFCQLASAAIGQSGSPSALTIVELEKLVGVRLKPWQKKEHGVPATVPTRTMIGDACFRGKTEPSGWNLACSGGSPVLDVAS